MILWTQSLVFIEWTTVKVLFPFKHKIPNKKYWSLFYFGNLCSYKNEVKLRKFLPRLKRNKAAVNIILYAGTHSYICILNLKLFPVALLLYVVWAFIFHTSGVSGYGVSTGKFLRKVWRTPVSVLHSSKWKGKVKLEGRKGCYTVHGILAWNWVQLFSWYVLCYWAEKPKWGAFASEEQEEHVNASFPGASA